MSNWSANKKTAIILAQDEGMRGLLEIAFEDEDYDVQTFANPASAKAAISRAMESGTTPVVFVQTPHNLEVELKDPTKKGSDNTGYGHFIAELGQKSIGLVVASSRDTCEPGLRDLAGEYMGFSTFPFDLDAIVKLTERTAAAAADRQATAVVQR